ncbi:MAG: InlB B-repeat-containing protein, partial [Acholeplasmataceae bacterium]
LLIMVFTVIACDDTEDPVDPIDPVTYTVTFNTNEGSAVASIDVEENDKVTKPADPTKEGFTFEYWYTTDEAVEFDFNTAITADIILNALWEENIPDGPTDAELIALDIESIEENLYASEFQLNLPTRGPNGSRIAWKTNADNVSFYGNILPLYDQSESQTQQIQATFSLGEEKVVKMIDVTIPAYTPVVIDTVRTVDFTNLTTEYDVADGNIDLYFEADGNVPYVSVVDFLNLLEGFVDPDVEFTITEGIDTLEIFYQYYDADYDETYDLIVTLNDATDTITTNDPGFYWAYVYSTETNYGRHIEYDYDNPDASFDEGDDVIYDLSDYNLEITSYNNDILLPYYIVNQLFAGSSYYNVYYNQDGLFGIYSLPNAGTDEYVEMKTSSVNGEDLPVDLAIHNFNMLAFNLDNFYGLQDIVNVETYKDLLMDNLDSMLTTDARQFDNALFNFIYKTMDELHTSYGYPSYYNDVEWDGPVLSSVGQLGSRGQAWYGGTGYSDGLFNVQDLINATWTSEALRPNYWFLDDAKTSVVITLDGFSTADIEEVTVHDPQIVADVLDVADGSLLLPTIASGTKLSYYNNSTQEDAVLEILVKGSNEAYVDTYKQALLDLGYILVIEPTSYPSKQAGYYTKILNDITYMALVTYDSTYDLVYIGIVDDVPTSYAASWPLSVDIFGMINSDSAIYMEYTMEKILSETNVLENVTIDLTYNTGGNVGALYRVVGFVTDQPFRVSSIDKDTNGNSSSYVVINGVPTYPQLNWSLLTSKVTFSAANSLATIFKENNLGPVIGVKSGGGAASITPILLPNGTAFTMSSNNVSAYRTGTGTEADPYVYHHNEFGIDPDHILLTADLYDAEKILDILNGIS